MAQKGATVLPPGVTPMPGGQVQVGAQGQQRLPPQVIDWLAHQNQATREYYTSPDGFAGASDVKTNASAVALNDLEAAQEKALAAGETLPDVDPNTGAGIHFTSDKQKVGFLSNGAVRTASQTQKEAQGIPVDQATINPTAIPLDQAAAHPEDVLAHYGPQGQQQVNQENAIGQTRTDTTGVNAVGQSLADETAAIDQGGLTAIDRARLQASEMQRGMQARAQEGAIMQQAEQQGRAGSAAQLVAQGSAQQANSNLQAQDSAQTMALGLARKDTLMSNRANQGQAVQNASDAIDHFNTQGQRDVEHANAVALNSGNAGDIAAQRAANTGNTDITNKGLAAGMDYRTGVNAANTGAVNTAETANKGPQYGPRGLVATHLGAAGPVIGAQTTGAGLAQGAAIDQAHLDAQNKALPWEVGASVLGGGSQVIKALTPSQKAPGT